MAEGVVGMEIEWFGVERVWGGVEREWGESDTEWSESGEKWRGSAGRVVWNSRECCGVEGEWCEVEDAL